ncbi:hypothetical protein Bbelb_226780 [Branchiostoma belcheri]|nr:hypothetical protein Bbelb_226780 [Branchiostoma belcheri]
MPAIGLSPRQQKQRRRMSDAKHRASVAASYKQLQKVLPSSYDYHGVKEISRQTKIVRAAVSHINKLEETLDKILKLRVTESPFPRLASSKVHPMTSTSTGLVHLVNEGVEVPTHLSSPMPNEDDYNNEVRSHSSAKQGPKILNHAANLQPTEPTSTSQETTKSDIAKNTNMSAGTSTTEQNCSEVAETKPSVSPASEDATSPETVPLNHQFVTSTPKMLVRPTAFLSPDPVRSYKEFEGYLLFYEHMVNQLQEQLLLPTQHLHSMQMSTTIQGKSDWFTLQSAQAIWSELPVGCRRVITATATSEVPKAAKLSRMKAVVSVSMDRASLQRTKSMYHTCGERTSTSRGKARSKETAFKLASPLPCEADFHKFLEQQGIELAQIEKKEYSTQVVPSADVSIKQEPAATSDGTLSTNPCGPVTSQETSARLLCGRNIKKELMWNGSSDGEDGLLQKMNCPVTPVFGEVPSATGLRSPVLKDRSLAKLPADGTYIWTVDERSLDLNKIFKNGGKGKTAMLPQQEDFLRSPTYQSLLSSGFLPHPPTTPDSHQVVPDLGSPCDTLTDRDSYGEFWSPEESLFSLEKSMGPEPSEMDLSNTSHSLECEEDSRDLDDDDL